MLEQGDGTPLKSALLAGGFDTVDSLVTIQPADIDSLTYEDPVNKGSFTSQ